MCDQIVDQAVATLRAQYTGELRFDEHLRPVNYVTAPSGHLIAPAMAAMLRSFDTVLFVPECADDALQVQITLEQFEEASAEYGALADRWRIYHGEPDDVYWAKLYIDAVRFKDQVIDGDAIMQQNPLAQHLPTLCRTINTDHRDDVRLLCKHLAQLDVEDPIVVGVDSLGLDVRRKFDVVRVPFPSSQTTPDAAMQELARMIDIARSETENTAS